MKIFFNDNPSEMADISQFTPERARSVACFHSGIPGYSPTPLHSLTSLASVLGIGGIFVKDEAFRFDLSAFKVLGSSYAIAQYMAEKVGVGMDGLTFAEMCSDELLRRTGRMTFVTATDGNHGRGLAWTARKLRQNAVVYMPSGSSGARLEKILSLGADASVTDMNYDATVEYASQQAKKNGWVLVQDTAGEGYEKIPLRIMQGYMTMALEAYEQLEELGQKPTHVLLQAGVGSMAAAVASFFINVYGDNRPRIIVLEPEAADCFYRSAVAGEPRQVEGSMATLMAGLACGKPSLLAWPILSAYADAFVSCSDEVTVRGMNALSSPIGGDPKIISGESGAVGAGLLTLLGGIHGDELQDQLKLDCTSRVLMFSTEAPMVC